MKNTAQGHMDSSSSVAASAAAGSVNKSLGQRPHGPDTPDYAVKGWGYGTHIVPVVQAAPKAPAMAALVPTAARNQPATPATSALGYFAVE